MRSDCRTRRSAEVRIPAPYERFHLLAAARRTNASATLRSCRSPAMTEGDFVGAHKIGRRRQRSACACSAAGAATRGGRRCAAAIGVKRQCPPRSRLPLGSRRTVAASARRYLCRSPIVLAAVPAPTGRTLQTPFSCREEGGRARRSHCRQGDHRQRSHGRVKALVRPRGPAAALTRKRSSATLTIELGPGFRNVSRSAELSQTVQTQKRSPRRCALPGQSRALALRGRLVDRGPG
jgi:hypothetical protein